MEKSFTNMYVYTSIFSGITADEIKSNGYAIDKIEIMASIDGIYPECNVYISTTNETTGTFDNIKSQLFRQFKVEFNYASKSLSSDADLATVATTYEDVREDSKYIIARKAFCDFTIDRIKIINSPKSTDEGSDTGGKQMIIHGVHPMKYFQNFNNDVFRDDITGSVKKILEATPVFACIYDKSTDKIETVDDNLATPLYRTTQSDAEIINQMLSRATISGGPAKFFIDLFGDPVVTSYASLDSQNPKSVVLEPSIKDEYKNLILENLTQKNSDILKNGFIEQEMFPDLTLFAYESDELTIGNDGSFEALKPLHIADLAETNLGAEFSLKPARKYNSEYYKLPISKDMFENVAATSVTTDINTPEKTMFVKAISRTTKIDKLLNRKYYNGDLTFGSNILNIGDICYTANDPINSFYNGKYVIDEIKMTFENQKPYGKVKGMYMYQALLVCDEIGMSRSYLDLSLNESYKADKELSDKLNFKNDASDLMKFSS